MCIFNIVNSSILAISIISFSVFSQQAVIAASGETHAMLYPCDCPDEPGGGFANRATAINNLRGKSALLLLDAGGFSAGGIYDHYTEGRSRDSIRTKAAIHAMSVIGYDAVGIGDEELGWNISWLKAITDSMKIPVVSANCSNKDGKPLWPRFVRVEKNGISFAITSVTTNEFIFPVDTGVSVDDPVESLRKIFPEMIRSADCQIILSHLGEDESRNLARIFPESDIILNGHRKHSVAPVASEGASTIMQFGFQGKSISTCQLEKNNEIITVHDSKWMRIMPGIPADNKVQEIIGAVLADMPLEAISMDLYLLLDCPHGQTAIKWLVQLCDKFPSVKFNVWFIGRDYKSEAEDSTYMNEPEEQKIWCAIQDLYPELFRDFCYLRASSPVGIGDIIKQMSLDEGLIFRWVETHGEDVLKMHFQRSERLSVHECPTLFINNIPVGTDISFLRIAALLCNKDHGRPLCDSLPECYTNDDCRKPGFSGICGERSAGKCSYKEDPAFDFIVIVPDSSLYDFQTDPAVNTTRELFPNVRISQVRMSSAEGRGFIKRFDPVALPGYYFSADVEKTEMFPKVQPGLVRKGKWFTFKSGIMKNRYFIHRKHIPGIKIYFDPLFSRNSDVFKSIREFDPTFKYVEVCPIVFSDTGNNKSDDEENILRNTEAVRLVTLKKRFPEIFSEYIVNYTPHGSPENLYRLLNSHGLSLDSVEPKNEEKHVIFNELSKDILSLGVKGPVELLVNNTELFPVRNNLELDELLKKIQNLKNMNK